MPGAPLRETAYAKINLALHVRERLPDGYHRIETLFAFAEDGDVVSVEAAENLSLNMDGLFADGLPPTDENLVLQAAQAVRETFAVGRGAKLQLAKNLPVASGIGGGSADAAATLRLLAGFWGIGREHPKLMDIAAKLGADVPACLLSATCRGEGRGDALSRLDSGHLSGRPLLLVNPDVAVSTAHVFRAWDGIDQGALELEEPVELDTNWRNDLAKPAIAIAPEIEAVLAALRSSDGARFVRMSGSGATCFALFDEAGSRDRAVEPLRHAHPDWWIMASVLR